ncbi:MAG: tetratricopeptide repeat protein [Thermoguttaceae bacterium]|nr:tetratricopeptide repeat protein [Thermoguttaceae bacterium]MDW8078483.1 tetratricopeptide repeat protein [Thermoguttaceae bacterium]
MPVRFLRVTLASVAAFGGIILAVLSWIFTGQRSSPKGATAEDLRLETLVETSSPELAAGLRQASQWLNQLAQRQGISAEVLALAAHGLLTFGRTEESIRLWQRCLEIDPNFVPAICGLAECFVGSGDTEQALKYFRRAAEIEPTSTGHQIKIAQELMRLAQSDQVIELLEPVLRRHPNDVAILVLLGQAYVHKKEYEKAVLVLERAINLAPTLTNAYYALAQATFALEEKELAKEYLKVFQHLKERDEEAHRQVLRTQDDRREILRSLAEFYSRIATAFLAAGDAQTAELILLEARKLSPECNPPLELLAWLYHRQGRRQDCLAILEELAKRVDYLPGQLLCGTLFNELGLFHQAEQALLRGVELAPHQAPGYTALASFYLRWQRKLPSARAAALRALDLDPCVENCELVAATCTALGDTASVQAAKELAAVLRQQPQE